jgi:hypothetical protein
VHRIALAVLDSGWHMPTTHPHHTCFMDLKTIRNLLVFMKTEKIGPDRLFQLIENRLLAIKKSNFEKILKIVKPENQIVKWKK